MSYCNFCNTYYGFAFYSCPDKDCKYVRNFIKENGIKKIKKIIEPYDKSNN